MGKVIKVHTDKRGKDHIDIYTEDPKEEHESIHINWDSKTGEGTIVDTTDGEKEETDVSCYLTTACMRIRKNNFNDNCEELMLLRWFRDNFVSKEDIKIYYEIAPTIVEKINNNENSFLLYNYIYKNVILKCINYIKNNEYNLAYNLYKESVLKLQDILLKNEKECIKKLKL